MGTFLCPRGFVYLRDGVYAHDWAVAMVNAVLGMINATRLGTPSGCENLYEAKTCPLYLTDSE
ncbi:protein of unknown function [Candidatus Nitrotoga arctica]|uniref:Uncharacterized protein n=1 Tax=Candidatus Nitrotoga arctica TaxID=453162 RepID=A0ABN8AMZ8_9PROT|nr:protein of unknown function [Candidatus Nitrotoga arctica]